MQYMFVYYDNVGDIKSIGPVEDIELAKEFNLASIPLEQLVNLLTGVQNPANFTVSKTGDKFALIEKPSITEQKIRYLDTFFFEVSENNSALLQIINNVPDKKLSINLSTAFYTVIENSNHEHHSKALSFSNLHNASISFTKMGDPYILLKTFTFSPRQLCKDGIITFSYIEDLDRASLFAHRILDSYSYIQKG